MSIYDHSINRLDGSPADLARLRGQGAVLIVNVASKCGLTPQYEGLEKLHERTPTGASPCSASRATSSAGQEPGTAEEIADVLLDHLRRDLPAVREDRRQRRRPPPALRRAHRVADAEGHDRRHPVELREVPRRARRRGRRPLRPDGRARRPRGGRSRSSRSLPADASGGPSAPARTSRPLRECREYRLLWRAGRRRSLGRQLTVVASAFQVYAADRLVAPRRAALAGPAAAAALLVARRRLARRRHRSPATAAPHAGCPGGVQRRAGRERGAGLARSGRCSCARRRRRLVGDRRSDPGGRRADAWCPEQSPRRPP